MFFQVNNITNKRPSRCPNCLNDVPARTLHRCEVFVPQAERRVFNQEAAVGFCHCLGFFRGSDHCQCCGCEEHEGWCDHICDGTSCTFEHDIDGRIR